MTTPAVKYPMVGRMWTSQIDGGMHWINLVEPEDLILVTAKPRGRARAFDPADLRE